MYNGKTSKLALQKTVLCTGCSGEGGKKGKNTFPVIALSDWEQGLDELFPIFHTVYLRFVKDL